MIIGRQTGGCCKGSNERLGTDDISWRGANNWSTVPVSERAAVSNNVKQIGRSQFINYVL